MRPDHSIRKPLQLLLCFLSLLATGFCVGCGLATNPLAGLSITPDAPQLRVGQSQLFSAKSNAGPVAGGTWSVIGAPSAGTVSADGTYTAPALVANAPVILTFSKDGQTANVPIILLNAVPELSAASPAILTTLTTTMTLSGNGFTSGSTIVVDGDPIPTRYIDSAHLAAQISVPLGSATKVSVAVRNPEPGGSTSSTLDVPIHLQGLRIATPTSSPRIGTSVQLSSLLYDSVVTGGTWSVLGSAGSGSITSDGVYSTPSSIPSNPVTVTYSLRRVISFYTS